MKILTRSDPFLIRVTKFDDIYVYENETSSSFVVSSTLHPFHHDVVTCCKMLLKEYKESNQSMVASKNSSIIHTQFKYCFAKGLSYPSSYRHPRLHWRIFQKNASVLWNWLLIECYSYWVKECHQAIWKYFAWFFQKSIIVKVTELL